MHRRIEGLECLTVDFRLHRPKIHLPLYAKYHKLVHMMHEEAEDRTAENSVLPLKVKLTFHQSSLSSLPIFLPPSPSHLQPLIYSRSLCLPSLTEHVFKVHSCRSWYQHFTSFSHWIKFHCIEITHFVNPLIHWWAVGLFIL